MDQPKSLCPGCKNEVAFQNIGGPLRQCPICGFQYTLSGPPPATGPSAWSGVEETFQILFKAFLIMIGIAVIGLGIAFAGCALIAGGLH